MISRAFIDRPILSAVLAIVIVLAGLAALFVLPVSKFPDITPPVVSVNAQYPGATANTLQQAVAAPIEEQVNGVDNMIHMESTSDSSGNMTLNVYFDVGTNADQATTNVNNRVQMAMPLLPESVKQSGVTIQKQSTAMLEIVNISSVEGQYDSLFVSNYAQLNVVNALKRLPGVGNVVIFGAQDYAMRIWLNPDRLAKLGLTPADIANAIREQNSQFAVGRIGDVPTTGEVAFTYAMTTQGRLVDPIQFENIILRSRPDGAILRLKDVARIELGAQNYSFKGTLNGKQGVMIGIYQQPNANALAVASSVEKTMATLSETFPKGISYSIPYNTTKFIKVSVETVVMTLLEAIVLVFLVVYLFLQNFRATLIPCIAIPVSLIGTFAGIYLLGFSINTLTLFGLVLAIGIVVDDAIVVLENVERIMHEKGVSAREATYAAMKEVTSPIIAIVLVLCAVFIPVAFLGGLSGELYKQFAITITISVTLSGWVALTLTPSLCVLLLKPQEKPHRGFFKWFNTHFEKLTQQYGRGVSFFLRRVVLALLCFGGLILALGGLFRTLPTALIPAEDQGYYIGSVQLPDAASLARTDKVIAQAEEIAKRFSGNQDVVALSGYDLLTGTLKTSAGTLFSTMKPWTERSKKESIEAAIMSFMMGNFKNREAQIFAFNPPAIPGLGNVGGFEFYIQSRGDGDIKQLSQVTSRFIEKASQQPELKNLRTLLRTNVPQINVHVNRERAKALGVSMHAIFDTLQSSFGSLYVNDFNKFGQIYRVLLQSDAPFRMKPEDIDRVYVRSDTGQSVPIKALVSTEYVAEPDLINRFNLFTGAKVMGEAAPGYSSGQAILAVERVAREVLPSDYGYEWIGAAYQEKRIGMASMLAFIFGIVMVFLILAAQYEKWTLPIAVLLSVPFALLGAFLAIWLRGLENDIYFQIGLLTLIGLSAKNAILIIEFASQLHRQGYTVIQAAREAARLRFRPIIMTSMAFVLGVLPLALSTGAGANSQHSIGTGVIGGMLVATGVAIFFIPTFFVLMTRQREEVTHCSQSIQIHEDPL